MKKNSIFEKDCSRKSAKAAKAELSNEEVIKRIEARRGDLGGATLRLTIGLDLGDRFSCYCVLDEKGEVIGRGSVATKREELEALSGKLPASVVALEVRTHSPWVNRSLQRQGHEVIVVNARRVKVISESSRKHDRRDAEMLARLA